jgi:uncharacterized protein (DUF697 family)
MARIGGPKDFWNVVKSVSVAQIEKEAYRIVHIAVVGSAAARERAADALLSPEAELSEQEIPMLPGTPSLHFFETFQDLKQASPLPDAFDITIDLGADRDNAPEGLAIYTVCELGGWQLTLDRIFEDRADLMLALARHYPVFRRRAAQRIITQTATANAQFSLLTGITAAFPITAILLPANALSDVLLLTKNQIMMVLRLAAAYGFPVDYRSRLKELAPILGNALGWRAIARQIVGLIPAGGFVAKAMIAYAGTVTIGKAAQVYYETGELVTTAKLRRLYHETFEASREKVRAMAAASRRRKLMPQPEEPHALESTSDSVSLPAEFSREAHGVTERNSRPE